MTKPISPSTALYRAKDPPNITDEGLVEKVRTDATAFAALYDRHVKAIYRYLYSKVNNHADAEDLTSQVFLAALESLHRYARGTGFRAWLFGIARRKAADFYRKRKAMAPLNEAVDLPAPAESLLAQISHRQSLQMLARQIARLDDDEQELLRLRFAGELSFAEIATLLKIKESTAKMRLYRLIERLQESMEVEND